MAVFTTGLQTYEGIVGPTNVIISAHDFSSGFPPAPINGNGYLARIGGTGVTQGFAVAFFNGNWYQCQPNVGSCYYDGIQTWIIDSDNTIIPRGSILFNSINPFTTAIGINTIGNWGAVVVDGVGTFTVNSFIPFDTGYYAIVFNISGGGANQISTEITAVGNGVLAQGMGLGVGQPSGCCYYGILSPGNVVSFRYLSAAIQAGLVASAIISKDS